MSHIAGFDYDSRAVYGSVIDEQTGAFVGRLRYDLDAGPGDALERVRRLRDLMPPRRSWDDSGIVAIGIESTYSQNFKAAAALARVQGALVACLPRGVPLYPLTANGRTRPGWKILTVGRTNASKDDVKVWALAQGAPDGHPQDLYDAFAIARATRQLRRLDNDHRT